MSTPAPSFAAPPVAYGVLRILIVLNWVMGAAILALLVVMPTSSGLWRLSNLLRRPTRTR